MIRPQPKPVRKEKPRRPLRARRRPRAETAARASRRAAKAALALPPPVAPRGTKHARRPRERGRMLFYSRLWCMLRDIALTGNVEPRLIGVATDCGKGPFWSGIEVAHLGDRGATGTGGWRRAPDDKTAPLCRKHHKAIDGKEGGKAPWYVALGREGHRELRAKLIRFAGYYWDALTDDGRAHWETQAAARDR